jgi:GT2 family glycosyltransferase
MRGDTLRMNGWTRYGQFRGKGMDPKVSIIILNWNGLQDTIECLESLEKVTYGNYEVVVVDNGSKGNDVEVLRKRFGDYICVIGNDENYGFAEGNNIGMRYALEKDNPDYLLLLNNDTVVDPDFLSALAAAAESDPTIGIVGPKVYFHGEPDRLQCAGAKINWWAGTTHLIGCGEVDTGQFDKMRDVDCLIGCALMIRRRMLEEVGLLYAGYFAYFEETDWCARYRRAGYRLSYAPQARIWHKRRLALGRVDEVRLYYRTRNRFLFMKRNATRLQFAIFLVQFPWRHLVFSALWPMVRQRNPKLLTAFCRGTYHGIRLMMREREDRE